MLVRGPAIVNMAMMMKMTMMVMLMTVVAVVVIMIRVRILRISDLCQGSFFFELPCHVA